MCCRAISRENVLGLTLPTKVTNEDDIRDAQALSALFGIRHEIIDIEPILDAYRSIPGFSESPVLIGNIMARTRMTLLYYYANRENRPSAGLRTAPSTAWLYNKIRG